MYIRIWQDSPRKFEGHAHWGLPFTILHSPSPQPFGHSIAIFMMENETCQIYIKYKFIALNNTEFWFQEITFNTFTLSTTLSWCSFHDHPSRTSPDGTGNGKTIEAAGVRGHPLTLTQAGRTVVPEHAFSYVVCAIFVNASARVDRFHAFVAASIVTTFVDTEAVYIRVAGLMTGSIKFRWTLSLLDYWR